MPGSLRQPPQPNDEDTGLEQFYTDSEYALGVFEELVTSADLSKRLLVIHGIGGVGKSTLLKMYVLSCRKHHIPVALVASEEASSSVDVLADWAEKLTHAGIELPVFQKTLRKYRVIHAQVEDEAQKGQQVKSQFAGKMGKTVVKGVIGMISNIIPIVGPLVGSLASESAEALIDWLRSFLPKPDIELYLDPTKRLDNDFLSDLASIASRHRIVLMTDTYEQMTALDDWMRELARRLPSNVLLIIAGRRVPEWNRTWQDWMGKAKIVELKEMTLDDLRKLVNRYFAYILGGSPDPKQVEAIAQFARGLPMVATTVVKLWVKYGLEDFQTVRSEVVADLVDRLLEQVPREKRPAFEAAAVLRYFNVEALDALLESGDAEGVYAELRLWPFIRSRKEGLAVHDIMREMINEALQTRAPKRFRTLHERAAVYYEAQLERATSEEQERYSLERLYHYIRLNEDVGIKMFQELAEELTRYRLVNQLRTLLNDVNTYLLGHEDNPLWGEYYNARLAHLEGQYIEAQKVYQRIGDDAHLEPKLRAYALCDWVEILCLREHLYKPGGIEIAVAVLLKSRSIMGAQMDVKLAMNWLYLSDVSAAQSNWEQALSYLEQPGIFFTECDDKAGLLVVLFYKRVIYRRQGNFQKMLDVGKEMWKVYREAGQPPYLRFHVSFSWEWILTGRYAEAENDYRLALEIVSVFKEKKYIAKKSCDLSLSLSFQGKCTEALEKAKEALSIADSLTSGDKLELFHALTVYGITCLKCGKLDKAEEHLTKAIDLGRLIHAYRVSPPLYLANVYEVQGSFDKAEDSYRLLQEQTQEFVQYYFKCGAFTGLVRVKYAQHNYDAIGPLWIEAEQLARHYEYNDFLTSLYLIRGHAAWDSLIPDWESGFDAALHYYQLALIHALRFNRFLLDEALSGRKQGTPLQPIIPHCLERGKEGHQMLAALGHWWQSGMNDIGAPRFDTISPIPEGLLLLEAERIARQREFGDGSSQKTVVEQINMA